MAESATASTGAVIAGASATLVAGGTSATFVAAKAVDYLVQNADRLQRTATVASHAAERAYINSILTIQNIMQAASPMQDPGTANGLKWVAEGA